MNKLFIFSESETRYFSDKQEHIELESCRYNGSNCHDHRKLINNKISSAKTYFLNKDYPRAIKELKLAFEKTDDLNQPTCLQCARFFRLTIAKSMENLHDDLKKMSTGFFGYKRYKSSYLMAGNTLAEFKKKI